MEEPELYGSSTCFTMHFKKALSSSDKDELNAERKLALEPQKAETSHVSEILPHFFETSFILC